MQPLQQAIERGETGAAEKAVIADLRAEAILAGVACGDIVHPDPARRLQASPQDLLVLGEESVLTPISRRITCLLSPLHRHARQVQHGDNIAWELNEGDLLSTLEQSGPHQQNHGALPMADCGRNPQRDARDEQ